MITDCYEETTTVMFIGRTRKLSARSCANVFSLEVSVAGIETGYIVGAYTATVNDASLGHNFIREPCQYA